MTPLKKIHQIYSELFPLVRANLNCGMHAFRSAPFECCPFALSAGLDGLVALRQIGGDGE